MVVPGTPDPAFWATQRVFLTGHTGFKGAWLTEWLLMLGAEVHGFSLPASGSLDAFVALGLAERMTSHHEGDIRNEEALRAVMTSVQPTIVLHFAAQSLVRQSYREPIETFATNVMGTVHVLEVIRTLPSVRSVVVVTTDKVYHNEEWAWGYREVDRLGGHDPYSASKACAELATAAYRSSFFDRGVSIATARAGNVIGGGDQALERLIPDCVRAFAAQKAVPIRSPGSVRPWQHVTEPLRGYLLLAELGAKNIDVGSAWNFGPDRDACQPVRVVVEHAIGVWGSGAAWDDQSDGQQKMHETNVLQLDSSRARQIDWTPQLALNEAVAMTIAWYRAQYDQVARDALIELTRTQIAASLPVARA